MSIADLLAVVTLEHAKVIEPDLIENNKLLVDYIERCRSMLPDYDLIHEDIRKIKDTLRALGML